MTTSRQPTADSQLRALNLKAQGGDGVGCADAKTHVYWDQTTGTYGSFSYWYKDSGSTVSGLTGVTNTASILAENWTDGTANAGGFTGITTTTAIGDRSATKLCYPECTVDDKWPSLAFSEFTENSLPLSLN